VGVVRGLGDTARLVLSTTKDVLDPAGVVAESAVSVREWTGCGAPVRVCVGDRVRLSADGRSVLCEPGNTADGFLWSLPVAGV
jgi:hypothetical protein